MNIGLLRVALLAALSASLMPAFAQTPPDVASTTDNRVTMDDDDRDDFPWGLLGLLGLAGLIPRKQHDRRDDTINRPR